MTDVISNEQADEILETRTHPRVTQETIEDKIADVHFMYRHQLTICVVTMKNGFMAVGKSAPAAPLNFNSDLGRKYAYENCIKELFVHEGYLLCEQLAG